MIDFIIGILKVSFLLIYRIIRLAVRHWKVTGLIILIQFLSNMLGL
ncbi:hypothetical protein Q3F51_12265 [Enterococcus faecium]|nr:hypothetical protein [Enterococcus faecium]EMF0556793.1 hypothetical protein [Enterococcus faecium]MDP8584602.1 hypothetical protein [Listeria innocua]MDQ8554275.1 hypothetical protein [Enterococcus faecium]HAQ6571994.1 hypothetical protein [Enterococcus faecium]